MINEIYLEPLSQISYQENPIDSENRISNISKNNQYNIINRWKKIKWIKEWYYNIFKDVSF